MKKIIYLVILLFTLSCSEESIQVESLEVEKTIVPIQKTAQNPEDSPIIEVDLNLFPEQLTLVRNSININIELLDFSEAKLYLNRWSHYELVSIPFKENRNTYYGASIVGNSISSYLMLDNSGFYSFKNFNDEVLLTIDLSSEEGSDINDSGFIHQIQDDFNGNTSNSVCDCHNEDSLENHQFDRMDNCGKYDYDKCMTCAEDVCDQDTKCRYGRTWTGPAYVISVMLHCAL